MKLLIVLGVEGAFPFLVPTVRVILSNLALLRQRAPTRTSTPRGRFHFRFGALSAHTCKSSLSWSRAVRRVLQVPSSQEANHIKGMSHVAAYTGSEALSSVMLDLVLHPHTVTQIPQPQLGFWERFTTNTEYTDNCKSITDMQM